MMTIDVRSVIVPPTEEGGAETVVLDETDWDVTPDQENPMEPPGFDEALIGLTAGRDQGVRAGLAGRQARASTPASRRAFTVNVKTSRPIEARAQRRLRQAGRPGL